MEEKIKPLNIAPHTIGEIPSSYLASMTYEEQLLWLCKKMKEVLESKYIPKDELSEVAITGEYDDLLNKPELSEVALTGDYEDLLNKPTIPDVSNFITKDVDDLTYYTKTSNLATVATSGSYNDLSNTPTIPDVSNFITKDVDDLTYYTKTSNLSTVATTGNYNDLSNKPTIPTVPTNVSAFTNDAGYITNTDYATDSTAGVMKANVNGLLLESTGNPYVNTYNYSQYSGLNNNYFIGKGTLENVLTGKGLVPLNYSNSEKIVGTWNNYEVYQKSYEITKSSAGEIIIDQISNLNFITDFKCYLKRTDNYGSIGNFYGSASDNATTYVDTSNNIKYTSPFTGTLYITLEYTKTS